MSKKEKLKWRKNNDGDFECGPFTLVRAGRPDADWWWYYVEAPRTMLLTMVGGETLANCKRACERLASSILKAVKPQRPKCEWSHDVDMCKWDTGCGQAHVFMTDGPKENDHKFCPYCGGEIKEKP